LKMLDASKGRVDAWVAEQVAADLDVAIAEMAIDQARAAGAKALFGEKYGDVVRVVNMGGPEVSVELCGGCHVARTSDIGAFRIIREEASSAGIRRITAVAGAVAADLAAEEARVAAACAEPLGLTDPNPAEVGELARKLKAAPDELPARVQALALEATALREQLAVAAPDLSGGLVASVGALQDEIKALKKEQAKQQAAQAVAGLDDLIAGAKDVAGVSFIAAELAVDGKGLRQAGEALLQKAGSCAAVLASRSGGKAVLLAVVSKDLVGRGLKAGELIQRVAPVVGGRGGGKPDQAQGGGPDADKLDDALAAAQQAVSDLMGGS
ncbi:MAG: DHHA1 domain-containing protein, partial [Planctomycetota bacterium]|nr:DHHA1 domain-containing protein [Planctomycetota bacterium]